MDDIDFYDFLEEGDGGDEQEDAGTPNGKAEDKKEEKKKGGFFKKFFK